MDKTGGGGGEISVGESRFNVGNFFSHSPEISVGESFTVALISGIEKVLIRGGGGCIKLFSPIFLSHSAEISVGESFTVALISGIENVWIRGGGGVSRFSVENFLSPSAEKFRRWTLLCCVSENLR